MPRKNPILAALEADRSDLVAQRTLIQARLDDVEANLKRFSALTKKKAPVKRASKQQPELPAQEAAA